MQDLVTVVIPIYNVEKYLDKCIESVVAQTYENLEIILVDDGSPDNCPQMCDDWAQKDSRIKVVHKENAGLGMARNTGLDYATGKYISFFDSDDQIDLQLVEKCVASFEEYDSDVVVFGHNNVSADGEIKYANIDKGVKLFSCDEVANKFLPSLFSYRYGIGVSACCKMYKLDVINELGLRFKSEREIISEDAYFALELYSKISKVSVIPQGLYYYYERETSLTHTYNPERTVKNNLFLKQSIDYVKDNGLPYEVSVNIMARYHGMVLGTLMQIVKSDLTKSCKHKEIDKILKDKLIHQTLSKDVCVLDGRLPKVFWTCLRYRLYFLCYLLLWLNSHK